MTTDESPQTVTNEFPGPVSPAPSSPAQSRFMRWIEGNPVLRQLYKVGVAIVGFVVLGAGILMIPFPGPGWLVVFAGLAILARQFAWAKRLLTFTKTRVDAWMSWMGRQPWPLRALLGLLTFVFVYGVIAVVLHLTGVPSWIPNWIPLWR